MRKACFSLLAIGVYGLLRMVIDWSGGRRLAKGQKEGEEEERTFSHEAERLVVNTRTDGFEGLQCLRTYR